MQFWNNFAAKHPAAAKWVREGGLFVIVSNLITVFKYLLLQFLPAAFKSLPVVDFGWPGIDITLFGETFKWNILGYDAAHGGLPYFCAYMVAMVIGECINFPIQRNFVFRSKGNLGVEWNRNAWGAGLFGNYVGRVANYNNDAWIGATWRFNGSARYDINDHLRLSLSVNNLLDKMPPKDATWANYPYYDTSWFDSMGRSYYVQLTWKLGGKPL